METEAFHSFAIASIVVLLIAMAIYLVWYIKLTFFTKNTTPRQEEWKDRIGLWIIIAWCIVLFIYYVSVNG